MDTMVRHRLERAVPVLAEEPRLKLKNRAPGSERVERWPNECMLCDNHSKSDGSGCRERDFMFLNGDLTQRFVERMKQQSAGVLTLQCGGVKYMTDVLLQGQSVYKLAKGYGLSLPLSRAKVWR